MKDAIVNLFSFRNLGYFKKFLIVILSFSIPLISVSFYLIQSQNQLFDKEQLAIKGNQYQHLIRLLLENISEYYRQIEKFLEGEEKAQESLLLIEMNISQELKKLEEFDLTEEVLLKTTKQELNLKKIADLKPSEIQLRWDRLQKELLENGALRLNSQEHLALKNEGKDLIKKIKPLTENSSLKMQKKFEGILNDLKKLLNYILETSHLLYDPDLDFFLGNVFNFLPEGQDFLNQLLALIQKNLKEKRNISKINNLIFALDLNLDKNKSIENQNELTEKLKAYNINLANLPEAQQNYFNLSKQFIFLIKNQILDQNLPLNLKDLNEAGQKAINASFLFWDATTEFTEKVLNTRLEKLVEKQTQIFFFSLVFTLVGFIYGFWMIRNLIIPLRSLSKAIEEFNAGYLKTRVTIANEDEVGLVCKAFNYLANSIEELIEHLQKNIMELTTSNLEISAFIKEQEIRLSEQESATEAIFSLTCESSRSSKKFIDALERIYANNEKIQELTSSGKDGIGQMEVVLNQMKEASTKISYKLDVLIEKITLISSVIQAMTRAAEQVNLLSLNAAIEAEKAGEYRSSFTVIASEIHLLSEQFSTTISDIKKIVTDMENTLSSGVMGVDKFSEETKAGNLQLNQSRDHIAKIIEQMQKQLSSFEIIDETLQLQNTQTEQINEQMTRLKTMAHQTVETTKSFHEILDQIGSTSKKMQQALIIRQQLPQDSKISSP